MKKLWYWDMLKGASILVLGIFLWIVSCIISNLQYEAIYFVQIELLEKIWMSGAIKTAAAFIVALSYVLITFLAVLLTCTGLVSLIHEKPVIECARKQLCRYFAFFGLLPNLLISSAWGFLWSFLPAKTADTIPNFLKIKPILLFAWRYNDALIYLFVLVVVLLSIAFSYGVKVNANIWFNRICGLFWIVFAYDALFNTIEHFKYGKWFLLFVVLCYLILAVSICVYKRRKEEPLSPKYEIFVISLEDFDYENDFEVDDEEYDFSIFEPKGNDESSY